MNIIKYFSSINIFDSSRILNNINILNNLIKIPNNTILSYCAHSNYSLNNISNNIIKLHIGYLDYNINNIQCKNLKYFSCFNSIYEPQNLSLYLQYFSIIKYMFNNINFLPPQVLLLKLIYSPNIIHFENLPQSLLFVHINNSNKIKIERVKIIKPISINILIHEYKFTSLQILNNNLYIIYQKNDIIT